MCAIDGSATSTRGMKEAIKLAKDQKAKLRFVHVIDVYIPLIVGPFNITSENIQDILQNNGEEIIKKAKTAAKKSNVVVDAVYVEKAGGRGPSKLIVEQAKVWSADLLVMGTHGLRGISRLAFGSTAEEVVRTCSAPILLVKSISKKAS